jgi:hypothetical protein
MATEFRPNRKPPVPSEKPRQPISRQKRKTMDGKAVYNTLRDIWLEQNPDCAICQGPATEVHHIVSGTAGRARSLLNQNTWLSVCRPCHEQAEGAPYEIELMAKIKDVLNTIWRLRK